MKNCVIVRFYAGLRYFADEDESDMDMECCFYGKRSVKDLIESLGVPHVEVELILVDGISRGFEFIIEGGERVSVYPKFEQLDISSESRVHKKGEYDVSFILDVHLGKLARHLRMLGFNSYYERGLDDPELARLSKEQGRILLTRDRGLLMRKNVERGLILRSSDPLEQLVQVLDYFELWEDINPLTRCMECNGVIEKVSVDSDEFSEIIGDIPQRVRQWCSDYYVCRSCGKVYWRGSHYENMMKTVRYLSTRQKFDGNIIFKKRILKVQKGGKR